jgi:hypothetical protein
MLSSIFLLKLRLVGRQRRSISTGLDTLPRPLKAGKPIGLLKVGSRKAPAA